MKSQSINKNIESFETAMNHKIAQQTYIVARLNSLGLTKYSMEAMIETAEHLMTCGFNVTSAHIVNNEIALLFDINERSYERNVSKFISILAGEASARLTQFTGDLAIFESRVLAIPRKDLVVNYFQSRSTKGNNSSWSYWKSTATGRREIVNVRSGEMIEDIL